MGALCALAAFAGALVLMVAGLVALGLHVLAAIALLVVALGVAAAVAFRSAARWMHETRLEATQRQIDAALHDDINDAKDAPHGP